MAMAAAGIGGLFSAILPMAMMMMMGGGQQQSASPAPAPPPVPQPESEPQPEDAADVEAAKRRSLQRASDRQQQNLLQLSNEDLTNNLQRKTLLPGGMA